MMSHLFPKRHVDRGNFTYPHYSTRTVVAYVGQKVPVGLRQEQTITFTVAEEHFAHGTFGEVFEGNLKPGNKKVALKKVVQDPIYRNRELEILRGLDHPNIVELKFYFFERCGDVKYLYLIMECMPDNLYRVIRRLASRQRYTPMIYVRVVMFQLFRALAYVHSFNICHRDVKPHNILLDPRKGTVKLCDFGSSKRLKDGECSVFYICSRYYRSPDLIFGRQNYGFEVDIWAAGCVMAELINNSVLFAGENRADQIAQIVNILGTPTHEEMKAMNPDYLDLSLPSVTKKSWENVFHGSVPSEALTLIDGMLTYAPSERVTAFEALANDFFLPLRNPGVGLPGDEPMPALFEWTAQEMEHMPSNLKSKILSGV